MSPQNIDAYLKALARALPASEPDRQAILDEVADHLREAASADRARGMAPADAERAALERFGSAEVVSKRMALQRAVERGRKGLWTTAIVNGIIAIALAVYWASWVSADPRAVTIVAAAGTMLGGILVVRYYVLQARRGSRPSASLESAMHAVALARFRMAYSGRFQIAGLGALMAVWSVWKFVADFDKYAARPWAAVVGFGGIIAIGTWTSLRFRRSWTRARGDLERSERDLAAS